MKIRTGFISNSSSTSFSLEATVEGFLPAYPTGLDKKFKKEFSDWRINAAYSSAVCASFEIIRNLENNEPGYKYDLELLNCVYTPDTAEDQPTPFFKVMNVSLSVFLTDLTTSQVYMLPGHVAKVLKKIIKTFAIDDQYQIEQCLPIELIYSQVPFNPQGDGWNGGDPMGNYAYTVDLRRCETKTGRISLIGDGKIEFRLQSSFARQIGELRDESEDIIYF